MRRRSLKARKPLRKNRIRKTMNRKALRRQIQMQLFRQAETKDIKLTAERSMIWNPISAGLFATRNVFYSGDILSTITQGTGQANRIGNKIRLSRLNFSFLIWAKKADNGVQVPLDVCMYVFTDKLAPTTQTPGPIVDALNGTGTNPYFFQAGNSTQGAAGTISDELLRVNDDRFTLHKKKIFKISLANQTLWHNNDYKNSRKFTINLAKYMPKNVQWSDGNATALNSRQVWIVFLPVIANDDTSSVFPNSDVVNIAYDYQVKFKDI